MKLTLKIAIVAALAAAIVLVLATKPHAEAPPAHHEPADTGKPRLLELGGQCTACKAMKPVLEALRAEYGDQLEVDSIDLDRHPDAEDRYDVYVRPTQVFLDASGAELFRHEGFFAKDQIVAKWRELGVALAAAQPASDQPPSREPLLSRLFAGMGRAIEGAPAIALAAAFAWGILSVLLSPCHLSSIPLIVAFIDQQGRTTTRRAFAITSLFAVGILITIGVIGGITSAAGRAAGDLGPWASYAVAALFLLVGLHLLGVVAMPWSGPGQVALRRRGLLAAFLLGLVFGIAIGPCTFAYMAPLLGVTFRLGAERLAYGAVLLVVYGVGHCAVIVAAGTSAGWVQRYVNWGERSRGPAAVRAVCGVLVCAGGLYLIRIAS